MQQTKQELCTFDCNAETDTRKKNACHDTCTKTQVEEQLQPAFVNILETTRLDCPIKGRFPVVLPVDTEEILAEHRAAIRIQKRSSGRRNRDHYSFEPKVANAIEYENGHLVDSLPRLRLSLTGPASASGPGLEPGG